MATVTGTCMSNCSFVETVSAGLPSPFSAAEPIAQTDIYATSGTGAGQLDTFYAAQKTLSGTAVTLNTLNLIDPAGNTITFARVREFIVQNTANTSGSDLKVEGAAASPVSWLPASGDANPLYCRAGTVLRISDKNSTGSGVGNVVGTGAAQITLDPGANSMTVNILIAGCSAQ